MTDITWGAEIAVDGNRPDWLKDDDIRVWSYWGAWSRASDGKPGYPINQLADSDWKRTTAIKLPADHPYYRATEAGYKYWPGGGKAPDDWNGGTVLLRGGRTICHGGMLWSHFPDSGDIIGYQQSKGPAVRLEGSAPFQGMTPEMINAMIDAVKAGDLAAAQALIAPPVDPIVLRAQEIYFKHAGGIAPAANTFAFDMVCHAIRESNRPPEEKLRAIVRAVVYTAHVESGHFQGWKPTDILSGKYDNTDLFQQMMKAAYNAI